jgi:hypothetical protein
MATAGRRDSLRLLSRAGAATTQLLSMTGWQILALSITGIAFGAAAAAVSILAVAQSAHQRMDTIRDLATRPTHPRRGPRPQCAAHLHPHHLDRDR